MSCMELVPDVPGSQCSTRVRSPTMRYGNPVEIPEGIQDDENSLVEKAVRGHTHKRGSNSMI